MSRKNNLILPGLFLIEILIFLPSSFKSETGLYRVLSATRVSRISIDPSLVISNRLIPSVLLSQRALARLVSGNT